MKANYRVRFVLDQEAEFEECNGESRPLTEEEYKENEYLKGGRPIPYSEYLNYYGNPDRHVYLMSEVQKQCPCCQTWKYEAGTGWIDFMDDSPELMHQDAWFTPTEAENLPGHLRDVALQDLEEAGYKLPKRIKCRRPKCPYWHVTAKDQDRRYCAQHQPKPKTHATS